MVKFEYYFARQSEPNMSKRTPAVLPDEIDPSRLPRHIAIICDGNGRWARERGMPRLLGHHQGYQSVREIVRSASDFGIGALTLYAFSTENWSRPKDETDGLMSLFIEGAKRELMELHSNNVRMMFSGDLTTLPKALQDELARHIELTRANTGLVLNICLNYGSRDEILRATKRAAALVLSGEIQIAQKEKSYKLGAGSVIGLSEGMVGLASKFTATAITSVKVKIIPFHRVDAVIKVLPPELRAILVTIIKRNLAP